jgi:hypothetical protein
MSPPEGLRPVPGVVSQSRRVHDSRRPRVGRSFEIDTVRWSHNVTNIQRPLGGN